MPRGSKWQVVCAMVQAYKATHMDAETDDIWNDADVRAAIDDYMPSERRSDAYGKELVRKSISEPLDADGNRLYVHLIQTGWAFDPPDDDGVTPPPRVVESHIYALRDDAMSPVAKPARQRTLLTVQRTITTMIRNSILPAHLKTRLIQTIDDVFTEARAA